MLYASHAWVAQTQPLSTQQYRVMGHQVMYCLCTNPFCGSWQKKSFPPLPASWWGQQPRKSVALSQHPSTSPPHVGKLTVLPCGLGNPSGRKEWRLDTATQYIHLTLAWHCGPACYRGVLFWVVGIQECFFEMSIKCKWLFWPLVI